ncbi:GNAT family N-acetyltransferase [Novosphingobium sp. 18050]|uniref:GNAT family N-acetyltransferase n=1 Tax=Novosphingobium sp. 18050 TaxID=2681398 RepID=UPI00135B8867|nr:GNAT family N-acetyltransferase [Novosphingobium sp. 18050]
MEIRLDDPAASHVSDLLAHHLRELRSVMGEHAFALDASGLSSPDVTFWTAWRDGDLAGFGALKQLEAGRGEVKSMRAAPSARGTGVGRALLGHIVTEARARGYEALHLETGTADLHAPAIALYRRSGFVSCGPFADYDASEHNQFMVLTL